MKASSLSILLLFLMPFIPALAQENIAPGVSDVDWDAIQTQVTSLLGAAYLVSDIVNVDSAVGNRVVADGAITDPYNTLATCYIFTTREQKSSSLSLHGAVGIYKNGNVIWQSGPVVNASFSTAPSITTTRDLNNDGNVEIVTSWFGGATQNTERLWIFNWNGLSGNLVTAVNASNESVLISATSGFEFVDVNGDNIYEITVDWYANPSDEQMQKITYSWNGSQYGKWSNPPQPLPSGFYPRDKVDVTVKAIIKNIGGKFSYQYKLQSMSSSKQTINTFILVTSPDSIKNGASPVDWDFGGVPAKSLGWIAPEGFDVFIKPGFADSSFYFESNRLPAILQSLLRGDNGNWSSIFGDTVNYTLDQWFDEAKSNSFKVKTVGPSNPPNPFISSNFLDTLTSCTTQSRTLGWIKDQTTANKYLSYFASAKTSLLQYGIDSTRVSLQQVLNDVNIDSTSNFTSEAYALLRYNTEYLRDNLQTSLSLSIKVFLQGPYNPSTGRMNTTLKTTGILAAHFGSIPIPAEAVDSINIEIRDSASAAQATVRKYAAAWLVADGTIRCFSDTTKSYVEFDAPIGSYYIVVHHRNHLAIMSAAKVLLQPMEQDMILSRPKPVEQIPERKHWKL